MIHPHRPRRPSPWPLAASFWGKLSPAAGREVSPDTKKLLEWRVLVVLIFKNHVDNDTLFVDRVRGLRVFLVVLCNKS